ncbi:MAG: hypothetical protein RLZZ244_2721 [Verrucomicrobiota bacterium]
MRRESPAETTTHSNPRNGEPPPLRLLHRILNPSPTAPILLKVAPPGGPEQRFILLEGEYGIGSDPDSELVLAVEGVARRHVVLRIAPESVEVESLGSGVRAQGRDCAGRLESQLPLDLEIAGVSLWVGREALPGGGGEPERPLGVPSNPQELAEQGAAPRVLRPRVGLLPSTLPGRERGIPRMPQEHDAPQFIAPGAHGAEPGKPAGRAETRTGAPAAPAPPVPTGEAVPGIPRKAPFRGEYTLVREIARGGMGHVFSAEDPVLKRSVAVKVSRMGAGSWDFQFQREAEVLAQLAHPNIVPVYAAGVEERGQSYYSMKLVKGQTLQAVLDALKRGDADAMRAYPVSALLTVFRKVCDAMAYAHSKGILHRDLKPENIMVGEFGEVLVMDWGLAKFLGQREDARPSTTLTETERVDLGMTLEGDVMGSPQYMSPEQAEGRIADLDERSDIYALGGILFAILKLHPPVAGDTVASVLLKVRSGTLCEVNPERPRLRFAPKQQELSGGKRVASALEAVILKAMAMEPALRYPRVEALAADVEAYQNGFATLAEKAGAGRLLKLWMARNRALSLSAALFAVVLSAFTAQVILKGREARIAIRKLSGTAPTFALRAQQAMREGDFEEGLRAAEFAVDLDAQNKEYHRLRGNALQVLMRWPEALEAYRLAASDPEADRNRRWTETLVALASREGPLKARIALYEGLKAQGRRREAQVISKALGDYWREQRKDPSVVEELVARLEANLLPVPGVEVLMSRTELTVGEWKLYLRAEGAPEWKQPETYWHQNDEHPVIKISWVQAKAFCDWLSTETGREWRLPTNAEWDAAVGPALYPWGDAFPPRWDDGNYAISEDGRDDAERVGADGFYGTAPVGSFKPNALGFYDLGGNAWEWMWDGQDAAAGKRILRGGGWNTLGANTLSAMRVSVMGDGTTHPSGIRLVRK